MTIARILITDDEESIRALLRTTLEGAGHEVTGASNGRIGLALYRFRPPDLVITDILMPEMNGVDMLLELTREFLHAKVIAISARERNKTSWMSRNSSGHGGASGNPLACRDCWTRCDTNWTISAAFPRLGP